LIATTLVGNEYTSANHSQDNCEQEWATSGKPHGTEKRHHRKGTDSRHTWVGRIVFASFSLGPNQETDTQGYTKANKLRGGWYQI
jgi:hypothetical protein